MIKKLMAIFIVFFLFNNYASAASICSYKEQTTLNQKAANVKVTYEVVTEIIEFEDMDSTMDVFDISIFNITEEFYVKVTNNINEEEMIFNYNDTADGVVKFKWTYAESVTNFTIQVFTTDKTSCPDEKYKTVYATTPRYNEFYDLEICQNESEFYLCQKFVNFSKVNEQKFLEQLDSYQKGKVDDSGDDIEDNPTLGDKIFNFLDNYKWYIIAGIFVLTIGIYVIYRIRTKKQRDLGL